MNKVNHIQYKNREQLEYHIIKGLTFWTVFLTT